MTGFGIVTQVGLVHFTQHNVQFGIGIGTSAVVQDCRHFFEALPGQFYMTLFVRGQAAEIVVPA